MSTSDKNAGSASAAARPSRSGIARTLGRRSRPDQMLQRSVAAVDAPGGGSEILQNRDAAPLERPSEPALPTSRLPPQPAVGDTRRGADPIVRSQAQMAAILARALARGQRNL